MKQPLTNPAKRNLTNTGKLFLVPLAAMFLFACQKELVAPVNNTTNAAVTPVLVKTFATSTTAVTLIQNNNNFNALTLNWDAASTGTATYTVEAAPAGDNFADIVEIATTNVTTVNFTVAELNRQLCQLIPAGNTGLVELRVRANNAANIPTYGPAAAIKATTFQPYTTYDLPQYMLVPGNYQNWDLTDAPKIVSTANNGEYEGYINFTNTYPQILFVKDKTWNTTTTYTYIGANKFGFGGNVFSVFGGKGIYLMRANTNCNTWGYTKIESFGLNGTAVTAIDGQDPKMQQYDAANATWTINVTLNKGEFRIRANNADAISFGKNMVNGYMVPDYKGGNFTIDKAGNYTIVINLNLPGNYTCNVIKNSNVQ